MIDDISSRLNEYTAWLRDKTSLRQVDDEWVEITTPYLDRHNDYLQIYARRTNGKYTLTDDGYVIEDLMQSGCALDTPKREALLKMTLAGFGVQLQDERLEVQTSVHDFPRRKHDLVQAMLAVNDMFYMARSTVESLFYEDVMAWMDLSFIRYTPTVKFTGKSGFDHRFDFVIPKSRTQPERIIQTMNTPTRTAAESLVFSWEDTRDVRPSESTIFALINDQEREAPTKVIEALEQYELIPVLWSRRDSVQEVLAA
jgi:hypothetical protein